MLIYPLVLGAQLILVSDGVPQFDGSRGCPRASTEAMLQRTTEACRNDEATAKQTLTKEWANFPASPRANCQRMVEMGGKPSYVELLTCLELAQQSKGFRETTGQDKPR